MRTRTILLIDDDEELGTLLSSYLREFHINCLCATTAQRGLQKIREGVAELVILDIMLPDVSGFDLCKIIRSETMLPVIMLSARGDVYDRILGLELGADDYLPKPFEPRELLARIESVLRRQQSEQNLVLQLQDLSINTATEQALLAGQPLELTHMEYRCLLYLVKHRSRVLTRDLLLAELRGLDWELDNRSVDILISRLRRKLQDDPSRPKYIATIRGSGYRFIA